MGDASPGIGATLGTFRLDTAVGVGGHCQLFLAHDVDDPGRRAAIKVLIRPGDPALRARLRREAEILARLDHDHVVGLLDAQPDATPAWIALQWIPGHPLSQWVRRPPRPTESILEAALGVAEALAAVHRAGLAHRDVKPANIMVRPDGRPVLIDFGLALDPIAASLTLPGVQAPTTLRYAPPEWFTTGESPDATLQDAYGLGLVLWELLVGAPVPDGPHDQSFDPGPQVDPALRMLVRGLTEPDPERRQSVVAAARVLAKLAPEDRTYATIGGPPTPTPVSGRVGPYQLEGLLGRGAMGVVYRARRLHGDAPAGPDVALKVLPWSAAASESARRRLLREARAASSLAHENLVRVLDSGEADGVPYVVMDLVEGETLAERLQRGPLPPRDAARLVAGLARGLAHAHERSVVHRDVKPSNVLLAPDGSARLTDFGIARDESEQGTRLTLTGQLVGTPAYMAPEQARGESVGSATDVWALGILLHELVTGSVPWRDTHATRVLHELLSGPPPALRKRAEVPRALDHVVARVLALDPAARPDAAAVARDLQAIADGHDHRVAALSLRARIAAFRPTRVQLGLAAAGLVLVTTLGGYASYQVISWRIESRRQVAAQERLDALLAQAESWPEDRRLERLHKAIGTFGREPALRRTPAESRAWLALADRYQEAGDDASALSATARAYTASSAGEERFVALDRLAQRFHAQWDWRRLAHVLPLLDGRESPQLAAARRDLAVVQRSPAADADDPTSAVVADLLAHTTATPWVGVSALRQIAPDRLVARVGRPESVARVFAAAPDLPELYACDVPDGFWLQPAGVEDGRDLYVSTREDTHEQRILHCDAAGTDVVQAWIGDNVRTLVTFDPDGDGEPMRLLGTAEGGRDLLELVRGDDGAFTTRPAHEPTNALDSGVHAVLAHDLDGDGTEELAVALGPWNAYELRVLAWRDGGFDLVSRVELGVIDRAAIVQTPTGPQVALTLVRRYRNRRVFPDPPHFGSPAGLTFVAFDGQDLAVTSTVPLPGEFCDQVFPGDVDGDGLTDLVLRCDTLSLLVHQQPDGAFEPRVLGHDLFVEGAVDLDGDGDAEVIAVDGAAAGQRTVVLGAGDTPLSPLELAPLPVRPAPSGLPTEQAESWKRAEDLVAWGLHEPARAELRTIAALTAGTRTSTLALLRAGEVAEAVLDTDAAEARYREAAQSPGGREAADRARLDLLERQHRYREALELARSVPAPSEAWAARTRSLQAMVLPDPIGLGEDALDPAWGLTDAIAPRFDPSSGALRIHDRKQVILRRRVRWDGRPITVDLDLTVHRMSLGGQLGVVLTDPQDQRQAPLGVVVRANGGGGMQFVDHDCWLGARWQARDEARWMFAPDSEVVDRDSAVVDRRWRATAYLRPELPTGLCSDVRDGVRESAFPDPTYFEAWRPFGPGEYDLTIVVDALHGYERAWTDATVHHLRIDGVEPLDGPRPSSFPDVLAALANRRPADALRLLEQRPAGPERDLLVVVAATALDDRDRALDALQAALRGGADPDRVERLVRTSPGWFEQALVRWDPVRGWARIAEAWEDAIVDHPDLPEFQDLIATLPPPALPEAGLSDRDKRLRTLLIVRRAQRLRELGRRSEADSELGRIAATLGSHPPGEAWERIERTHVRERARLLLDRGDRRGAIALLTASVHSATSPVMASLEYDRDPVLAGIREDPEWRATARAAAQGER